MENVASWLVLANYALTPYLAHRRKRRWWIWFLISLLLGPFSLILLWVKEFRKNKKLGTSPDKIEINLSEDTINEIEETLSRVEIKPQPTLKPSLPSSSNEPKNKVEVGWVYILTNPMFPDLTKIGFTTKSVEDRMAQLDSTGLPEPFIEHYRIKCVNPKAVEARLHTHFSPKRYKKNREFFEITPQEVYEILRDWGVGDLEI